MERPWRDEPGGKILHGSFGLPCKLGIWDPNRDN